MGRKSCFVIPVSDMNAANNIITNHLQTNKFQFLGQFNDTINGVNLTMYGYKCQSLVAASFIEYAIYNNTVYMYGYANSPKNPLAIDDNSLVGGLAKTDAISKIMPLVQTLQSMNQYQQPVYQQPTYNQPMYQQPTYQQPVQPMYQQQTQATMAGVENTTNTYSIVALIIGIASLILSIFGSWAGIASIGIGYYMAILGMRYKKNKGLCISAIVLLSVAIVINIIMLILKIITK